MFDLLSEISVMQADLIKSFAIFFLLIIGNFVVGSIFTCYEINKLKNHIWVQRGIAFALFYFLVALISDTGKLELTPPIEKLVYSLFYFVGFLIMMRLDIYISMIVLLLVFLIYFIELNKDFYLDKDKYITNSHDRDIYNDNKYWFTFNWPFKIRLFPVSTKDFTFINKFETIIYYVILVLLIFGFIAYGGEIKDTVSKSNNLTWFDVIGDINICKLKDRKSFWHYFKVGLGLKL